MLRRLGQQGYRAESPSLVSNASITLSHTDPKNIELALEDVSTPSPTTFDSVSMRGVEKCVEHVNEHRIVEKPEVAMVVGNICKKLNTIVNLVHEFSTDALGLRESADDLLDELRTKIRPYLINLDIDMLSAEAVLRYNIDRSNINETRIDWLLTYTKYQKEMRRVLNELSGDVCDDLEDSLDLRRRGEVKQFIPSELL
ncbi:unnamed protein product [Heligmosomoides polygyrus]|uniref:Uncharacterized protein n=1 Tax=Heligmosomoides polygyrus TaxID=6339 RepID=A0A183GUV0_HELPZ|nr:unnamed protein product [Heligmosomoides polygyrus]